MMKATVCFLLLLCISNGIPWPIGEWYHVLFILADDMGQWAMGAYGNKEIHTPNLDRLAKEGLLFTNAFCNTPVCSASRTSYFTGRLPSQHAVHDCIEGGNGCEDEGIPYTKTETFYTDIIGDYRYKYTCGISGKIHIGDQQVPQHSFKHWFVHQRGSADYYNPPMVKNGTCVNVNGYVTDIITDDAIDFLKAHASDENPFYLSVHYTAPHEPYTRDGLAELMHPPDIVRLYDNCSFSSCPQEPRNPFYRTRDSLTTQCLGNRECLKGYYAAVTAMDYNIGRLLKTLNNLGLDNNTVVVFTSDHGFNAGHHGMWGKGNAVYPLNFFETSLRIPLIWRHKGAITPGVEHSVVQVVDFAPTLLDYAGRFTFVEPGLLPGESYRDLLISTSNRNSRVNRTIYGEYGEARFGRFDGNMKFVTRKTGHMELYDLTRDKNEKNNLLQPSLTEVDNDYNTAISNYDRAMRYWFSYYENPWVSGWIMPVTGQGQTQSVANGSNIRSFYNNNKPAFKNRGF